MISAVAVLFARADSHYKRLPGLDVWDQARDALTWPGGLPVVAHPPCTRWSQLNGVVLSRYPDRAEQFAWGNDGGTFAFALAAVRRYGGVLEHPAYSRAFAWYGLPKIGRGPDRFGGWACEVRQCDWGHRAEKKTWLYLVGVTPDDLPALPPARQATALVCRMPECRAVEVLGRAEREHTPPAFAAWLVAIARRAGRPVGRDSARQNLHVGINPDLQTDGFAC